MFDFRKIEAFCKVCEQRSFSKAGEALFLSQPTVSAHIQALERDFEMRLLDRMGRTVVPTPAGAVLYRHAKQAFARLEAAKAEMRALAHEITGDLVIGSSSMPAHHVLPDVLAAFAEAHPKVRPSLMVSSSGSLLAQVREGSLMAAIIGASPPVSDPDIIAAPLLESAIIIIAPPGMKGLRECAPAGKTPEALPEIDFPLAASLPWIMREESSVTRKIFEQALLGGGYNFRQLQAKLTVDSNDAAVRYVRAGLGIGIATYIAARESLQRGDVFGFHLSGVRAVRRFSQIINARRLPFPAATVFLEFLRQSTHHLRHPQTNGKNGP